MGCGVDCERLAAPQAPPNALKRSKMVLSGDSQNSWSSTQGLQRRSTKNLLFSSSYASVTLRGILQKNIDEASKKNNFQKKVYQKIFICRGDRSFSRAKKCKISPKSGKISIGNQWKLKIKENRFPLISH